MAEEAAWERIGTEVAEELAELHGRPLPASLPLAYASALHIAADHGVELEYVEAAADVLLAAAMRRWVLLASH